jgi:hypothetical protein
MWNTHTYNVILFNIKRKEIQTHAKTWMNLEETMLREISQLLKDKYSCHSAPLRFLD